jgi:tRNA (adenine22-N1)-methyltransferase
MQLSKRLEACLSYTEGFMHLADIGTDHALLPIEAVLRGYVMDAIGIDNNYGPFLQAKRNVSKYQLEPRITLRLGDGLEKITNDTEVVVISGMGGELIASILTEGNRRNVKRFVLQPNRNVSIVRQTIMQLGYQVVDEIVLQDSNKYYDVIVIEPGQTTYSEQQIKYGPINLVQRPYYFIQRLQKELEQCKTIVEGLEPSIRRNELQGEIDELEGILDDRL